MRAAVGAAHTGMASAAWRGGLAPREAEKLTAPVSLTRPSTVPPGPTAAASWATTSAAPAGTLALSRGPGTGVPTAGCGAGAGAALAAASIGATPLIA